MSFADKILSFLTTLHFYVDLPENVQVMNPLQDEAAMQLCTQFYKKYYSDNLERRMIIGINPGRFGGGITGIPFTDPIRLKTDCEIENHLQQKPELSSVFVYNVIKTFGGLQEFYKNFYITAVSPLGFTKDAKNLNYYDDKALEVSIKHFVVDCMKKQLQFGINTNVAFCLGDGKNYKYLSKINEEMKFFKTIIPLSHPRFIMQYKLKKKEEYIQHYLKQLKSIYN